MPYNLEKYSIILQILRGLYLTEPITNLIKNVMAQLRFKDYFLSLHGCLINLLQCIM